MLENTGCAHKNQGLTSKKNKKKSPKNRLPNVQDVLEKNAAENLSKIDFYSHLGLPKPPKISPKSAKIEKKSNLQFRLQPLNEPGARRNGLHPGSQAQEASKKASICLSIWLVLLQIN